tara:strand:- start:488 stop:664 length:177 start_codon:yes stop_codon:yes gene_type:complete
MDNNTRIPDKQYSTNKYYFKIYGTRGRPTIEQLKEYKKYLKDTYSNIRKDGHYVISFD